MNNKKNNADIIELGLGDALLAIHLQNDFLPGGRLPVAEGDQVIPVMNRYIDRFTQRKLPVFATRDWHPKNHGSFIKQGGPWPEHCIAGSTGAEFARGLHLPVTVQIFPTGTEVENDGYSGFESAALKKQLEKLSVSRLFIGGLATDYCVLNTVCDALDLNYQVLLLTDAMRAVNVHRGDGEEALNKMISKGAIPVTLAMIQ
ncbi:MAG: isochorismatase family protein [Methylococcales bacterium]|nr:isochorismatase family protein [Methylococcales bacterium]